jgi:hypothetical protein
MKITPKKVFILVIILVILGIGAVLFDANDGTFDLFAKNVSCSKGSFREVPSFNGQTYIKENSRPQVGNWDRISRGIEIEIKNPPIQMRDLNADENPDTQKALALFDCFPSYQITFRKYRNQNQGTQQTCTFSAKEDPKFPFICN